MAEAAAVIALVSSIASLVDLSAKVASRLHEFAAKTGDVPESFRALSVRLPLLTATLHRIAAQTKASRLPNDVAEALQAVVDSTSTQVTVVQTCLSTILPPENASKIERAVKALKSLAREDKMCRAVDKIHQDIDFLVLHQTTQHIETGDRILEELSKLTLAPPVVSYSLGVNLGKAPQIDADAFIGRRRELEQLQELLPPKKHPHRQCVVCVSGMGGVGKTQLGLAHVRECGQEYSTVFWVNAQDETSLRQSMADLWTVIDRQSAPHTTLNKDEEQIRVEQVRRWLSEPDSDRWLVIFDNYDDPDLPGIRSPSGYDIRRFFPHRSQGSVAITTRSTRLTFGKSVKVRKLEDVQTGVAILSQRSGRDLSQENAATDLAKRLDGLPIALATAGTYLGRTDISCEEYLVEYHAAWNDLVGADTEELVEYERRTLASTWTISLDQVKRQDADAAQLLTFWAYLGSRDLWYELIRVGEDNEVAWMGRVTESKTRFRQAMSRLQNYNLVDVVAGQYQLHPCLHDWLVEVVNRPVDSTLFSMAMMCLAYNIEDGLSPEYWPASRRLLEHIEQLILPRFAAAWQDNGLNESFLNATHDLAGVLLNWNRYDQAEAMLKRALGGKEKVLGVDHTSTLRTVNNLGNLYRDQGKLEEGEAMLKRALGGKEKVLGVDHTSTLGTVNNLGNLYHDQGKLEEGEAMLKRALGGKEKVLGADHTSTLKTVNNLGNLYRDQDKLEEGEAMLKRALSGYEKVLGVDHTSTLSTVNNLALLYYNQGKLEEAEAMLKRALGGNEKVLGVDHTSTLNTINNLAYLYRDQGKLEEAEAMLKRALGGREKVLGVDHTSTLDTVNNLGNLYRDQDKLEEAEAMLKRALSGKEKALGVDHTSTLRTVNNLGNLYRAQGKLVEAEAMLKRALSGKEKALGVDHTSTRRVANNLALLYRDQGRGDMAEQTN